MKTKEYREQLAGSFLHVLEERGLEWRKEWQGIGLQAPVNGSSGHRYRGINRFYLAMVAMDRGYQDYRWCTFNQIKANGWKLIDAKGQGVKVEYWFPYDIEKKRSVSWEDFRKDDNEFGEKYVLRAVYKTVFNADLIEGMPVLPPVELKNISEDVLVSKLAVGMGVEILNDGGDQAFYRPSEDKIHLPLPAYFETDYAYNSTALHELAHATGAAHRLNRNISGRFGSPEYAFEELVAEISSCFMSASLQIEQSKEHIENHKAYVQSWIQSIREKPDTLIHAIQQAEKTASYMEYKAELISQEEFELVNSTSMDLQKTVLEETYQKGQKQEMSNKAAIEMEETGNFRHIEEGIPHERENNHIVGETLRKVRMEQGYTIEKMAELALISDKDLQLMEEGQIYPDKMTLQIISNVCTVYSESLEKGQIVPKKSREELHGIIRKIRGNLVEIKSDTAVLLEFAKKYGIQAPEEQLERNGRQVQNERMRSEEDVKEEYYVIEDQKTGQTITNSQGKEIQTANREDAESIASALNNKEQLLTAESLIREYEKSIGRTDSVLERYNQEQVITYAVRCQKYLEFGSEVDSCLNYNVERREAIKVCDTPELFVRAGCNEFPMHITQKHLRACMRKAEPENMHYHGLTVEEMKRIPEALESPVIIADSLTRHDSIVALLGYREEIHGFPVMVSIVPNGKAVYILERVDSNFITSIYGRENVEQFVRRLIEQDKLIYINKEKSQELALVPLQLRQGHLAPNFDTIIKKVGENVNAERMEIPDDLDNLDHRNHREAGAEIREILQEKGTRQLKEEVLPEQKAFKI